MELKNLSDDKMARMYLLRHPPTEGGKIIKGNKNIPLLPGWEPRLEYIARKLANEVSIGAVLSSPLDRTRLPAMFIADYFGITQGKTLRVIIDELLLERNVGRYEGKTFEEMEVITGGIHPHVYIFNQEEIPDGESKAKFREEKVRRADDTLIEPLIRAGENMVISGHGWWLNELRNLKLGQSLPYNGMPNYGMIVLDVKNGAVKEI